MSEINKLIEIAKAEEGYLEKKSNKNLDSKTANAGNNNYTKYARDLDKIPGFYNGKKNGYPWCDVFVDWCFVQAFGVDRAKELLLQPNQSLGAGCTFSKKYYKNNKQYHTSPKVGDQIFFKDSKGSIVHTGIVIGVDSKNVTTIEGNTSSEKGVVANGGCVRIKKYAIGYKNIDGYGRPKFKAEPKGTTKYVYNCDSLNVRSGAGVKYPVVRTLPVGTKVTVYEVKSTWARIGDDEWCSNNYLTTKKPNTKTVYNCTSLRVRNKPSIFGKVVGSLKKGTKVTIYATSGSWSKISASESKWCSSKYLK
jgi:uncharacterized protein YgiM (DUF1202 family)